MNKQIYWRVIRTREKVDGTMRLTEDISRTRGKETGPSTV